MTRYKRPWDSSVIRKRCEAYAGVALAEMERSKCVAESFLTHADPRMRATAIAVLYHKWRETKTLASLCEQVAIEDADPEVRSIALIVLGSMFAQSRSTKLAALFGRIVHQEQDPKEVRFIAYRGLLLLFDIPFLVNRRRLDALTSGAGFDEIDWQLIKTLVIAEQ